ncbi:MAG: 2-oxo acid dehydrogenase subunit E2 [Anaerolineae bacterium]|nr:2-oxo acid dehydrogenase subunit E2 [Anaerolineae bacterium]
MAVEIVMPRLGWTMEEGTLVEWIKHDGDLVAPGDILFTVESDKALNEVEAFDAGIFRIPPDSDVVGKLVPVGTLLAYIVQPGEEPPFASGATSSQPAASTSAPAEPVPLVSAPVSAPATNGDHANGLPAISPRAKRVAGELGVEWTALQGSGRTGRIVERDVRAAAQNRPAAARVSPVARRAAGELGVDVDALAAQLPGQRITREAVERAAAQPSPAPTTADETRAPIPRLRQVIAERMAASSHTTAPVTLTTEVDATELVKVRASLKAAGQTDARPVPTYNDLLAKLVAETLAAHPQLNARLDGDSIVTSRAVHMGLAVDTDRGLFVPVIREAQAKTIRQIAAESAALIAQVRDGSIRLEALSGGTFTITNLGPYEIDAFTPIINLPQCAILGVGRIVAKQVVLDAEAERVAIRHMMFLSLTFDHRLVDGAPAARFLQQIKRYIEQPYLWLVN